MASKAEGSVLERLQQWGRRPQAQRLAAEAAGLAAAVAATAALPRVPQPESYHSFAGDHRTLLGVPHAPNVLSNAAIAAAGLLGLAELWRRRSGGPGAVAGRREAPAGRQFGGAPGQAALWAATFAGMLAAAAGSAYYHWAPSTPRLAADRLGMGLAFGWMAAAALVDRRGPPQGPLAWAVAAAGVAAPPAAALYWLHTELAGAGDLRWYALAQALSGGLPRSFMHLPLCSAGAGACESALHVGGHYLQLEAFGEEMM